MSADIVKDSPVLKKALLDRWEELNLSGHQVALYAQKMGMKGVTDRSVSVWKNHSHARGALNQMQLIQLAFLFGIRVSLKIGEPEFDGKKLKYVVPVPFNEEKALAEYYSIFPPPQIVEPVKKKKKKNG